MEQRPMGPNDYIEIVRRRKWLLLLPAVLVMTGALLFAVLLPPVYRSTATILIEEQDIPKEFVTNTVNVYAEQQLQIIYQRVMSTTKLLEIIEKYGLYANKRDHWTTEQVVARMRSDISMEPVSAEVIDRRTGRPTTATIAFTLSYASDAQPSKVQQIANVLTSLFLEENMKSREQQASGISTFIEDEMNIIKEDLGEIDAELAKFKTGHINELPELLQVNIQTLSNLERNQERLYEQLTHLREREGTLHTELASLSPNLEEGRRRRLEELKTQLVFLQKKYTAEYPDVVQTKAEIAELENQLRQRNELEVGERAINPAYVTLASQLSSTRVEIESLKAQIADVDARIREYSRRIETTPRIEAEYNKLVNNRRTTQAKLDDLMVKYMEARVSQGLERDQKGERFTLLEAARLPEEPFKPNRLAIVLIGIVLAVGAGIGAAAVAEFADESVRKAEDVRRLTDIPVLGSVPHLLTTADLQAQKTRLRGALAGLAGLLLLGVIVFHFQIMNLGVFVAKVMIKLGM